MRGSPWATLLAGLLVFSPLPSVAQEEPFATRTKADYGLAWGAGVGGALVELSFGVGARGDVLLGAGDSGVVPMAELTVGLRHGG